MAHRGGNRGRGGYNGYGGFNQYSSGGYGNNNGGYGGGYSNQIPPGMNQFGFSTGQGVGRFRGKNRGNHSNYSQGGGNNYNYNNNPEWYDDNGNGGGGCFDDGSFNMDEGYVYSHQMPFPFKRAGDGGGRGSYNMGWQRGEPRWKGGPKKQIFKKKQKKTPVANPVAVQQQGVKKSKKKKKSAQQNEARVVKFKQTMTLKNKYRSVKQNRHLSPDDQLVLVFLKNIAQEIWQGEDSEVHFINFAKFASRHPNALKLFTYECKKQLDVKYDPTGEEEIKKTKLEYLLKAKAHIIDGFKKVFKQRAANEDMDAKEKLLDTYIAKLTGEEFSNDDIPVEEEYLFNKDHSRREEEFVTEFMYDFVFNCYECFKFKPTEHKTHTKDLNKRLRYHLDCQIIPFLIVESMRAKSLVTRVPSPINSLILLQASIHQEKNEACVNQVVAVMVKKKENVVTPLTKYIEMSSVSTDVVRDFADCILLFDRFATYTKFRMIEYSPHILLPREQKMKIFNELVDKMYSESLDIIRKKESFESRVFPEMQKDKEFKDTHDAVDVKEEPVEVKEEVVDAMTA